jgi:hypothetical protein
MKVKTVAIIGIALFAGVLSVNGPLLSAEIAQDRVVRLAELEIDLAQLESYKVALQEEIETSIRVEPGVLKLYTVSVKDHPTQIRLFEMYAEICDQTGLTLWR